MFFFVCDIFYFCEQQHVQQSPLYSDACWGNFVTASDSFIHTSRNACTFLGWKRVHFFLMLETCFEFFFQGTCAFFLSWKRVHFFFSWKRVHFFLLETRALFSSGNVCTFFLSWKHVHFFVTVDCVGFTHTNTHTDK